LAVTWPAVVLWVLILAGAVSRGPLLLYLTNAAAVFGSLTMLPGALTGSLNLPAQTVCAALLLGKILFRPNNFPALGRLAFDIRRLGLFTVFVIYADLTAWIFPRLFAGRVLLYPLNGVTGGLSPLVPTSANFTQTVYLDISVGILFAMAVAGRDPVFRKHFLRSILVTACLLDVSGCVDLVLSSVGRTDWLLPFHNSTYALLINDEVGTQKRVVGFMAEASAYGGCACQTLSFLVFWWDGFEPKLRKVAAVLIAVTAVMTFLSTSSTAYAGLITLILVLMARPVMRILLARLGAAPRRGRGDAGQRRKILLVVGLLLAPVGVWAVLPAALLQQYQHLIDLVLFQKIGSESYIERSAWTHAAFGAFQATGGIGVGIGSVRSSSWYANILASTGVAGVGLLMAGVALVVFSPARRGIMPEWAAGLKLALIPGAVMMGLAGTTPDPGVWSMASLGLTVGLRLAAPPRAAQPRAAPPLAGPVMVLRDRAIEPG
jgi:hypothetical protein